MQTVIVVVAFVLFAVAFVVHAFVICIVLFGVKTVVIIMQLKGARAGLGRGKGTKSDNESYFHWHCTFWFMQFFLFAFF